MKVSAKDKRVLRIVAIVGLLIVLAGLGALIYEISQPCKFVVNPGCGAPKAQLFEEASWMNSSTSLTLKLLNAGSQATSLLSYHVDDSAGRIYQVAQWTGPTIQPGSPVNVTFAIDGKDFTFHSNSSYSVGVFTSIGYWFTFSVFT